MANISPRLCKETGAFALVRGRRPRRPAGRQRDQRTAPKPSPLGKGDRYFYRLRAQRNGSQSERRSNGADEGRPEGGPNRAEFATTTRWWKRSSTQPQVKFAPMRKGTTRLPYSPKRFRYRSCLPLLFRLASLATFPKGEGFCCLLYILLPTKNGSSPTSQGRVSKGRGREAPSFGRLGREDSKGERGIETPLPFGRSFPHFWRVRNGAAGGSRMQPQIL